MLSPRPDWALFLDIDGTLIEHADHPEGVTIPKDLPDRLTAAQAAPTARWPYISGRTIDWMDRKFAPALRLRLAGAEVRPRPDAPAVPIPMPKWRALLEAGAEARAGIPGVSPSSTSRCPLAPHPPRRARIWRCGDGARQALGRGLDDRVQFLHGRYVIEVREGDHRRAPPSPPDEHRGAHRPHAASSATTSSTRTARRGARWAA